MLVALPLLLSACKGKSGPPAPPPPTVGVLTVQPQQVPAVFEFTAEAQAVAPGRSALARAGHDPRAVLRRRFRRQEGGKAFPDRPGDLPGGYTTSAAAEETARASFDQAKRDLARGESLYKGGAISQRDYDVLLTRYQTPRRTSRAPPRRSKRPTLIFAAP